MLRHVIPTLVALQNVCSKVCVSNCVFHKSDYHRPTPVSIRWNLMQLPVNVLYLTVDSDCRLSQKLLIVHVLDQRSVVTSLVTWITESGRWRREADCCRGNTLRQPYPCITRRCSRRLAASTAGSVRMTV